MKAMRWLFVSLITLGLGVSAQAEEIVEYEFTGSVTTPSSGNVFVDASAVSLSAGSITYGSAQTTTWISVPYAQGSGGWNAEDFENSKYWEFTLTADEGASFSITNVSFLHRETAALSDIQMVYTINGDQIETVPFSGSATTAFFTDAVTGYTDLTQAVITIHGWGATSTGGDFRIDSIIVAGEVDEPVGDFPPSLASTPTATSVTDSTATLGGNITSTGGPDVTERGVIYSDDPDFDPESEGTTVSESSGPYGTGEFSFPVTGLDPETPYWFVAYAVNSEGTGYSSKGSFTTTPEPPGNALVFFTFTGSVATPEAVGADMSAESFAVSAGSLTYGFATATAWENAGGANPYVDSTGGWGETDQASAKHYIIDLSADEGKAITVTNISFLHRRSGAGPQDVGITINDAVIYSEALSQDSTELVNEAVAGVENQANVVIKIQGWNGGTGSYRLDNVLVQGVIEDEVESEIPPTVAAPSSASIVGNTAVLGGTITDTGDSTVTERGIYWSVTESFDPELDGTKVSEFGSFDTGAFTVNVSGLTPTSTIYFVAFARNAAGPGYSAEDDFAVGAIAPTVTTPTATDITLDSATLGGTITQTGGEEVTERGVIYSDDPEFDPESEGTTVSESAGPYDTGAFTLPVTGLDGDTEYYFVAFATNAEGTSYSTKSSFSTLEPPPAPPSDLLVYYTFTGSTPAPTYVATDVLADDLTVSTNTISYNWFQSADWIALGGTEPYAYSSGNWNAAEREEAKYFSIVLEAEDGASMTITNISFLHRRQTTGGPLTVGISINGASVYEDDIAAIATTYEVNQPVTGFEDLTSVEIRIEGWDGGTGEYRVDNILVQGTVDGEGPPPTPDEIDVVGFTVPAGGNASATFQSQDGVSYSLEYTTNLTGDPVVWTSVDTLIGDGNDITLEDDDPADVIRVYRVVTP